MKAKILVIEYESRHEEHVRAALVEDDFALEIAADVDEAVDRCARFEPALVIITSVLPNITVEDAITQLRARAGLRVTPILIVMSGYQGENTKEDAARFGAQDIIPRPFGSDELLELVEELIRSAPSAAATQAIPADVLESMRESAGFEEGDGPVTSADLFGEILSDMEGGEYKPGEDEPFAPSSAETSGTPGATETPDPPTQSSLVDDALSDILEGGKRTSFSRTEPSPDSDVDKLLADTLPGIGSAPPKTPTPPDPASVPQEPPLVAEEEAPAEPPPVTEEDAPVEPPPVAEEETPVKAPPVVEAEKAPVVPPSIKEETPVAVSSAPVEPPPDQEPDADVKAPSGGEFGQYVIEERIATGGMADVFKARMMGMEGFQKTVAIKRILSNLTDNEDFVRMFIDEAKLAAQLNHNNIIHIYDLGKVDRSHYIAMEFIEGRDLRSILTECARRGLVMPISLALYITNLLASALDYAHKKRDFEDRDLGLVHRDVSPSNVLISNDGDVKLCDFGIAKAASKATETRAGALKGKLQYMSPEQAWGKDIDHRSDIFSLGLVLYEMLTSEKVFSGTSELSVLEQVRDPMITAPSLKNPKVSKEIDQIVFLAVNPDREQRYQSADEMQRDVEKVLRDEGWAPDRAALAALLGQLDGETDASPIAREGDGVSTPAELAPPIGEPPDVPPPGEPPTDRVSDGHPDRVESSEQALAVDTHPVAPVSSLEIEGADPGFESGAKGGSKKHLSMVLGLLALIVVVAGGWWMFGRNGPEGPPTTRNVPITIPPTETPTPEPTAGLLSEEELIESAREAAAAEIAKQEEDLRKRLEDEFPTPTPIPPTPSATPTATATPSPTPTATPVPPTATPVPTATPIPPTPTPEVREGETVTAGPGVILPVVIFREQPVYPSRAQAMKVEAVVEAEALVGTDGGVEEVRIVSTTRKGIGFEKSSEEAIMKWRFKPATKKGVKVRMWMPIRIPFRLR